MKNFIKRSSTGIIALTLMVGSTAAVKATPSTFPGNVALPVTVSVSDVTDWGTTPMEEVNGAFQVVGYGTYNGAVYAGINQIKITIPGQSAFTADGFCIDPFHFSDSGPDTDTAETLAAAPKAPGGPMGTTAATKIEQLWYKYFGSTQVGGKTGDYNAAVLQVAIWDIVSQNVGSPVIFGTDTATASVEKQAESDIAGLTAGDPTENLVALQVVTGTKANYGQDYVVAVPDASPTFLMLAGTLAAFVVAAPKLLRKQASQKA